MLPMYASPLLLPTIQSFALDVWLSYSSERKHHFYKRNYERITSYHFQALPVVGKAFTFVPRDVVACLPFGITVCLDPFATLWDSNNCWFLEILDSLEKSKQKDQKKGYTYSINRLKNNKAKQAKANWRKKDISISIYKRILATYPTSYNCHLVSEKLLFNFSRGFFSTNFGIVWRELSEERSDAWISSASKPGHNSWSFRALL